jgi:hypothetical protein
MAHAINPVIQEVEIGRMGFKASTSRKLNTPLPQQTSQTWWIVPVIPAIWEAETQVGETQVKSTGSYLKNS